MHTLCPRTSRLFPLALAGLLGCSGKTASQAPGPRAPISSSDSTSDSSSDSTTHPHGPRFAFDFLRRNPRPDKPRTRGLTEVRGPYYTVVGKRYLADLLETMGPYIDSFKFSGGSFMLMDREVVQELIDLCHQHDVLVSTGGFIEAVLPHGPEAVERYIDEAAHLGFDIIEVSNGMIVLPDEDFVRIVERVAAAGVKAKAEIGIQLGAGSSTATAELQAEGTRDTTAVIALGRRLLDAGAWMLMLQAEGVTENVTQWRTDVISRVATELGTERVMFQAADPSVLRWYVKSYGSDVNLFVDHSQIIQLESLRSGTWGPKSLWGRVLRYP
ncbi:MAG: phosphosulfolactate synthase [Myxococcota bacterium]